VSTRPTVVVTRRLPGEVEEELSRGFDARLNRDDRPLGPTGLQEALRTADALLCTVTDRLTAEVLSAEPLRARMLANFGVGFNHIDTAAAKDRGLAVSNTPDVLTEATADIAITLLLMVSRRAGEGERHVRCGAWTGWRPTHMMGTQVSGKTLGLIGMGRIARAVARRAHHGFGMRVIFQDPFPPSPAEAAALGAEPRPTLEQVLEEADFISLHCPAMPETHHLMNRGDVVDEAALVEALADGTIAGAGLDVYEREPQITPALLTMENVVLFPHLGSATHETRIAMGMRAVENLRLFFDGAPLRDRVV
jgi:lactate dehydrogenase-like 2-hydroxyacid dehydrogenase